MKISETIMKCMYCQGALEKGVTPFHMGWKGYHLTFNFR